MAQEKTTGPKGQLVGQISEVMEAASERQNGMRPPGGRTAASPAWHSGGDGAPARSLAPLSVAELETVQYL